MGIKTHTKDDGTQGECRANKRGCPKGQTDEQHQYFESRAALKEHNEKVFSEAMEKEHGEFGSLRKVAGSTSSARGKTTNVGANSEPASFEDSFNGLLTSLLVNRIGREDLVLKSYEQETDERFSNCDTCSYEETVVRFTYALPERGYNTYTYQGDFGELIRELSTLDSRLKA